MSDSEILYEKLICENINKGHQLRLVVNTFKDVQYLHIRKYFQSFDGEWVPSKEGVSMEYTISSSVALLDGLLEIVSHEEGITAIAQHFSDKIINLKSKSE